MDAVAVHGRLPSLLRVIWFGRTGATVPVREAPSFSAGCLVEQPALHGAALAGDMVVHNIVRLRMYLIKNMNSPALTVMKALALGSAGVAARGRIGPREP